MNYNKRLTKRLIALLIFLMTTVAIIILVILTKYPYYPAIRYDTNIVKNVVSIFPKEEIVFLSWLNCQWLPDSSRILFSILGKTGNTTTDDIYVVKPDGKDLKLLHRNMKPIGMLRILQNGRDIIWYEIERDLQRTRKLYLFNISSGQKTLLLQGKPVGKIYNSSPSDINFAIKWYHKNLVDTKKEIDNIMWSPDGKWILYKFIKEVGFWVENIKTGKRKHIDKNIQSGRWSRDSSKFYFWDSNSNRYKLDIPTLKILELPKDFRIDGEWSPDSKFILSDNPISIFSLEDKKTKYLGNGQYATWSPDGFLISYVYKNKIYLIRRDGKKNDAIVDIRGMNISIGPLKWSPDGKKILVYVEDEVLSGRDRLYVIYLKENFKEHFGLQ